MLARSQRSGILITSSGLGSFPAPGIIAYSCSKAFSTFLGQALHYEVKEKIDVISFECGETNTKMLKGRKGCQVENNIQNVTLGSLRDLGHSNLTYGSLRHELGQLMLEITPRQFLQKVLHKASIKIMAKIKEKEKKAA